MQLRTPGRSHILKFSFCYLVVNDCNEIDPKGSIFFAFLEFCI